MFVFYVTAGVAVALKEAADPSFTAYIEQVQTNARALAQTLQHHKYTIVTHGTDNHIVLWDTRNTGLSGSMLEKALEWCDISANKNAILGDTSALNPGGVRLGTLAMTTRGMSVPDMLWIGNMIHRIVQLAQRVHTHCQAHCNISPTPGVSTANSHLPASKSVKVHQFISEAQSEKFWSEFEKLKDEVRKYVEKFPMPGLVP